ncbi:PAS domain-containing protein [Burkholderia sp. L27(2015)]|uniref:helix-turn-helix transcriptional regulator n=1 Tax=Burkholderia sp. L27(2015) TaxID=1641858 RepID=UPI00131D1592|nr:PAS domain-containing protein [Burkholderia sp. L27(2015)]
MINEMALRKMVDESSCCFAGYKGTDYIFHHANAEYAKIVGLKHPCEVVGRTAYDMPSRTAECAALFHAQDDKVINTRKAINVLGIHPDADGGFRAYKHFKEPLRDEAKNIAGIFFSSNNITSRATYELSIFLQKMPIATGGKLLLDSGCYLIGRDHVEVNITQREHEVLFYSIRRKQAKFIASVLNITPRTVYKYTESLRRKFDVRTSSELKDKAREMGLLDVIPLGVFNESISISLNQNK